MNQSSRLPPLPYDQAILNPTSAHIGVGAFHRAHQQSYYDDLARAGELSGVLGVNLTSPDIAQTFNNQGRRYCLLSEGGTEGGEERELRVIGTLCSIVDAEEAVSVDWDPITFVTLTITEKGYCHFPGTTELDLAKVADDMQTPDTPGTAIGYLALMLERRRRKSGAPITLASCDNVPENGRLLQRLLEQYATLVFPGLLGWMTGNVSFPVSMVDRIVPSMSETDKQRLEAAVGEADRIGIVAETFRQWVIEDAFAAERPALERAGVQIVPDVTPYTKMKYRLLNGLQSAYAELGRICGCETTFEAANLPALASWAAIFHASQCQTLVCPDGENLAEYCKTSLSRLQNPHVRHSLNQIATDASFKLPQRIAEPAEDLLKKQESAEPQAMVLAAWAVNAGRHGADSNGVTATDLNAETMAMARAQNQGVSADLARYVLSLPALPKGLAESTSFKKQVASWIGRFGETGPEGCSALIGDFCREALNA